MDHPPQTTLEVELTALAEVPLRGEVPQEDQLHITMRIFKNRSTTKLF